MRAVILAAGSGTRLLTKNALPKALVVLEDNKSILQHQVESLHASAITEISVVVGYQQEKIMRAFPALSYISNARYRETNTAKSLELALADLSEDFIWLNGDVLFHPSILQKVLQRNVTSMVVNRAQVAEEEVKYCTDPEGKIVEVSKQVANPEGEAVGINLFKAEDLPLLKRTLSRCSDDDYFEKGIEFCLQEGINVWPIVVDEQQCKEIDFPEDLVEANALLKSWLL